MLILLKNPQVLKIPVIYCTVTALCYSPSSLVFDIIDFPFLCSLFICLTFRARAPWPADSPWEGWMSHKERRPSNVGDRGHQHFGTRVEKLQLESRPRPSARKGCRERDGTVFPKQIRIRPLKTYRVVI